MRPLPAILLATVAVLAGCIAQDAPPAPLPDDTAETLYEDDRIKIQNITNVPYQAPTLLEAPKWRLGEWWSVSITEFFSGETHTSTRVVAGAEDDAYLVGMPTHDFSNGLMVLHVPGFGQVMKDDLSFEIHDCPFHPLRFPLEEGATWETQFECRAVTAEVTAVEGNQATVVLVGQNDHITLTYDAEMRQIVKWTHPGYAEYVVKERGEDFHLAFPEMEGLVTVPHMHDVIFQHGRVAGGALSFGDPAPIGVGPVQPNAPDDVVTVDPTYDRVSFVLILGNLWGLAPGSEASPVGGFYRESATAPDGTLYQLEQLPSDPAPFKIAFYKHDDPDGDWHFEHIAAGPGLAMAEGIAYHVYDVELPSGRILPSVGEHQHGTDEGH